MESSPRVLYVLWLRFHLSHDLSCSFNDSSTCRMDFMYIVQFSHFILLDKGHAQKFMEIECYLLKLYFSLKNLSIFTFFHHSLDRLPYYEKVYNNVVTNQPWRYDPPLSPITGTPLLPSKMRERKAGESSALYDMVSITRGMNPFRVVSYWSSGRSPVATRVWFQQDWHGVSL